MANFIKPEKRVAVIRLLLSGFSIERTAKMVGISATTVMNIMHIIGLKRGHGHRSPGPMKHRNQCKEWVNYHPFTPPIFELSKGKKAIQIEKARSEYLKMINTIKI